MAWLQETYTYKHPAVRLVAALADLLLWPIAWLVKMSERAEPKNSLQVQSGQRMLVAIPGGIGDIVLAEPLIRELKRRFPECPVDALVRQEISPMAGLINGVDKVLCFPEATISLAAWPSNWRKLLPQVKNNYEAGFDVKGDPFVIALMTAAGVAYRSGFAGGGLAAFLHRAVKPRSGVYKAKHNLLLLDESSTENVRPRLILIKENKADLNNCKAPASAGSRKKLVFHTGAGETSKLWPAAYWQKLKVLLPEYEIEEITIGGSLLAAVRQLGQADIYVGLDTGLTHTAAALNIPTVCLFSLSHDPAVWGPAGARILAFTPPASPDLLPEAVCATIKTI